MSKRKDLPVALTIAGSDSGGGAGIQADLKTFAALGVHGTSAITCVTAQSPSGVYGIESCSPEIVRKQIEAVFVDLPPKGVKIGMLYSKRIVRTVADFFSDFPEAPLVIDPVMASTSGNPLLKPRAVKVLCEELLPKATLITPNVDEAQILSGQQIHSVEDLRAAAKSLYQRFGCAVLVKGGHLRESQNAVDALYTGSDDKLLSSPFVQRIRTHGTGCTYSAAIAAYLAQGLPLLKAVQKAKQYVTQSIAKSKRANGYWILNSSFVT